MGGNVGVPHLDYDLVGRLETESWYAVGGSLSQIQTFAYDNAGRLESAVDPDGTYTFAYNAADRVTSVQEPFGLALTISYDFVGNRTGVQDSKGGVTTVAFDALNRQTSEQVGGSGISAMRFDYAYTDRGEVVRHEKTRAPLPAPGPSIHASISPPSIACNIARRLFRHDCASFT